MMQDNLKTVWKKSKIRTRYDYASYPRRCIITQQQTSDPTVWFVGANGRRTQEQFPLSQIMDSLSFFEFTFNFAKVNYIHFVFVFCFQKKQTNKQTNQKKYTHSSIS